MTMLIDFERYPVDQPDIPAFAALLAHTRATLKNDGCAVLDVFLARHLAIFSYIGEQVMAGAPARARQLYDRALPDHLERAGHRVDESFWIEAGGRRV